MKKTMRIGLSEQAAEAHRQLAAQAALALLERSIRMHHRRLAVQRLNTAVALGACVPDAHWIYCRDAATASRNADIQSLFVSTAQAAHAGLSTQPEGFRHG